MEVFGRNLLGRRETRVGIVATERKPLRRVFGYLVLAQADARRKPDDSSQATKTRESF